MDVREDNGKRKWKEKMEILRRKKMMEMKGRNRRKKKVKGKIETIKGRKESSVRKRKLKRKEGRL